MSADIQKFIERWRGQTGKETGNLQPFLIDLCDALGLQRPGASAPGAEYCFEYSVPTEGDDGYTLVTKEIDLYKKGSFILEGKQTPESARKATGKAKSDAAMTTYDKAVARAFGQAKRYAQIVAEMEAKVPFLIVCDVGVGLYVWDSFQGGYGRYASRRAIAIEDLARPDVQEYIRAIWTEPESLNPNAVTAAVTREIASGLGELKVKLATTEPDPKRVALFLMRVVFTFFAEDIGLLPSGLFSAGLALWERKPDQFQKGLTRFWETMDEGGQYGHDALKRFNGGLFKDVEALPLTWTQIRWMRGIADKSWKDLDPSIFGALLEGALDPTERKKHGVHYTPRAHIQRLIDNTFGRDLWAEWEALHQDAQDALDRGHAENAKGQKIKAALMAFRKKLGEIKILDPACGSGNFLYVAFDTLKRIEEEVIATLELFGETKLKIQAGPDAVTPKNLMGIELDDWAASIAELVIWIAYVQWYFRLYPQALSYLPIPEPVLQNYDGIRRGDAVLAWAGTRETGRTRWGGRTMASNLTGKQIPDPADQVAIVEYVDPKPAEWPRADYIIGNPPFLGNKRMREMLGDGYADALRAAYPDVPDTVDVVMYWWHRAALEVRNNRTRRFGLITTYSITKLLHRDLVGRHLRSTDELPALKILWTVADHPWGGTTAKTRIAMTVGGLKGSPRTAWVTDEGGGATPEERADSVVLAERDVDVIHADLRTGVDVDSVVGLKANGGGICSLGFELHGGGFRVSQEKWVEWGKPDVVHPYVNGNDLMGRPRGLYVIDLHGLGEEDVKRQYPHIWQHIYDTVKPERDQNNRQKRKDNWWLFGELGTNTRLALNGLRRFIVTAETTKHRVFAFLDAGVAPDHALIVIASDDAYVLGVLSSNIHKTWASAKCSHLGSGERYNKSACFDPFPFPDPAEEQKTEIRALAEALDAHVKAAQARGATITEIYNLAEALRADASTKLSAAQRLTHERAATTVLLDLHEKLDAAVSAAYGWPGDLSDEETLARLTALNAERAAEEAEGKVRWLRPGYQNRD